MFATEAILKTDSREVVAGPTTADPRSHYGQPVFRCEEFPAVGDEITLIYCAEDGTEEDVKIVWGHEESTWILTHNPASCGAEILAVHLDSGQYTRLGNDRIDGTDHDLLETLAADVGCKSEDESAQIASVVLAVESGELWAEGAVQLPDSNPLGCILL